MLSEKLCRRVSKSYLFSPRMTDLKDENVGIKNLKKKLPTSDECKTFASQSSMFFGDYFFTTFWKIPEIKNDELYF